MLFIRLKHVKLLILQVTQWCHIGPFPMVQAKLPGEEKAEEGLSSLRHRESPSRVFTEDGQGHRLRQI